MKFETEEDCTAIRDLMCSSRFTAGQEWATKSDADVFRGMTPLPTEALIL